MLARCSDCVYEMQKHWIFICIVLITKSVFSEDLPHIPNYGMRCLRCICEATIGACDLTLGCIEGYCGPFRISRVYWIDAGNITLPQDTPERYNAYEDCSLSYECAQRILLGYFHRYGRDCNGDGVTNCDDYAMIHVNGRFQCHPPLNRTERGKAWLERYTKCDPLDRKEFGFYSS